MKLPNIQYKYDFNLHFGVNFFPVSDFAYPKHFNVFEANEDNIS